MIIFKGKQRNVSDVISQLAKHSNFIKRLESLDIFNGRAELFEQYGMMGSYGDIEFDAYFDLPEIDNYHYNKAMHSYESDTIVQQFVFKVCYSASNDNWFIVPNNFVKNNFPSDWRKNPTKITNEEYERYFNSFSGAYLDFLTRSFLPRQPKVYEIKNVYLFFERETGQSKIGISKDVAQRLKTLSYQSPSLEFVKSWKGTHRDEKALHALFEDKCVSNEWFYLEDGDIDIIENYFNSKSN